MLSWETRAIVSPISGTTRDAIDTVIERQGQIYRLIDTAGIRRKKNVEVRNRLELAVLLRQSDALK